MRFTEERRCYTHHTPAATWSPVATMAALLQSSFPFPHAYFPNPKPHHLAASAAATTRPESPNAPNPASAHLRRLIAREDLAGAARLVERSASRDGEAPDVYLCTKLIRNLCRRGRTSDAARVLRAAEGSGSPVDVFAYNTLVAGYCRYGHLDAARRLIGSMPVAPDAYTYTPLIRVLCDRGRVADALSLLDDMLRRGCQPNVVTYTVLLEAMCRNSGFAQAMAVVDKMRAKGCTPNIVTSSSMACAGKAMLMTQGSS